MSACPSWTFVCWPLLLLLLGHDLYSGSLQKDVNTNAPLLHQRCGGGGGERGKSGHIHTNVVWVGGDLK